MRQVLALSVAAALLLPGASASDAPEYLAGSAPIPSSLEDSVSATDGVGAVSDIETRELVTGSLVLPRIRALIPETGEPFFDDAIFYVRPRFFYRYRDNGDGTVSEAFAGGGELSVESGYFQDFVKTGMTVYTSQELYGPPGRPGSGLLTPDQESYTVLGEAYAQFKLGDVATLAAGRQRIDEPYLNANDARMTPNTFESLVLSYSPIEELKIGAGHTFRIKFRNSSDFEYLSERAGASGSEKGATSVGFRYDLTDDFHLAALNHYGWDTFNTFYLETERFIPVSEDFSLKAGFQFTDQRSVGDELIGDFDAQHFGVKFAAGYESLITSLSYTWTSDDAGISKPWGGSPSYNSVMISDFDRAGEEALRFALSYDLSDLGLPGVASSATYLYGDTPDSGSSASPDQREFNFNLDYRPEIPGLDSFWLRIRYAVNDRNDSDGGLDLDEVRIILNYAFSF